MRVQLPKTSVSVFRIKTRSRKVTEAQPAVGRSVRRKRKFAVMGQSFGEVFGFFRKCREKSALNKLTNYHHTTDIISIAYSRNGFGNNVCTLKIGGYTTHLQGAKRR